MVSAVVALAAGLSACGLWSGGNRSAPEFAPSQVHVGMDEYRFTVAGNPSAGRVVFEAVNTGAEQHNLVIVPLPTELPPLAEHLASNGPRQAFTPLFAMGARPPGQRGTFAIDLKAGRYGVLCLLPGADGIPHTDKGMGVELRVAEAKG